jgi:hypothetical protein
MPVREWVISLVLLGLTGCVAMPRVPVSEVKPADIVNKIECELYTSAAKSQHGDLYKREWIAVAALTLQGDESEGVDAKISYINPLSAMTNFMFSLGGTYSKSRQQIFSLNVTINIKNLSQNSCKPGAGAELTGDLHLDDVVDRGLAAIDANDRAAEFTTSDNNAFGSTIKFVLSKGVSGGPQWTLTHVTGPTGDNGLLSANTTDTQQLIISFVPQLVRVPPGAIYGPPGSTGSGAIGSLSAPVGTVAEGNRITYSAAVAAAQNNNLAMLFQSLRGLP